VLNYNYGCAVIVYTVAIMFYVLTADSASPQIRAQCLDVIVVNCELFTDHSAE